MPQNRERVFVFSIRKDVAGASAFRFPRPFPLKRKLRNILEEDVDEKYYLKDETVERFIAKTQLCKEQGKGFGFFPQAPDEVSRCVCVGGADTYSHNYVYGFTRDRCGKIVNYHPVSITNTLHASSGSGGNTDQFVCVAMRGRNKSNPNDHRSYPGIEYEQRIEVQPNHDTIATMGTGGNNEPKVLQSQPRYRIRKLTERECFRLMGVEDADIDTVQASGVSRSAQYKMAGNSIVVDVLYHIFRQAFTNDLDTKGAVVETIKVDVQQLKLF